MLPGPAQEITHPGESRGAVSPTWTTARLWIPQGPLRPGARLRAGQRDPQRGVGSGNTGLGAAAGAPGATWDCRPLVPTDARGRCHPDQAQVSRAPPSLPENCLPHVPPPGFLRKVRQDAGFGRSSSELSRSSEGGSSGLSFLQLQEPPRKGARGLPRAGD